MHNPGSPVIGSYGDVYSLRTEAIKQTYRFTSLYCDNHTINTQAQDVSYPIVLTRRLAEHSSYSERNIIGLQYKMLKRKQAARTRKRHGFRVEGVAANWRPVRRVMRSCGADLLFSVC